MQKRFLNLQEYQSKKLMDQFGVRTQKWVIATTKAEAEKAVSANLSTAPPYLVLLSFRSWREYSS